MSRNIHFQYQESKAIWKHIEIAADKAMKDRHGVFRDLLQMTVCCLSREKMEELYLETIKGYGKKGEKNRAIDEMIKAYSILVQNRDNDLLGDVFQGAITGGEAGQFFTPEPITRMMAMMTYADKIQPGNTCYDPACGSGRTILAVGKMQPKAYLYGADVDHRCVMMTAINMAIRGLQGYAIHSNSLTLEVFQTYWISNTVIIDCKDKDPITNANKEKIKELPVKNAKLEQKSLFAIKG